jgi:S1-C subfamily serine protease
MLNKIMIVLLVIVIAGSGVTGYYVYNQNKTIDSLKNQLTASQQAETIQINAVKNSEDLQITALGTELTSDQAANSTSITGLQNRVNQADEENTILGNELNNASTQITTLDGKIDSSLNALSGQISNITPGINENKIYSTVSPSIVQITDGTCTYGAGFIYDTRGYIVTAAHVIDGLKNISVILSDGTVSPATVVGSALHSDVALLKITTTTSLTPVKMAADNSVNVGDVVLAVGHPFDLPNSLSSGVVSQLQRMVNIGGDTTEHWLADLIQFDAAANPGNSGGPLFDKYGNVVGMVDAGIASIFGNGINFAVSSARISQVVSNLINFGSTSYPMIGVFVDDITQSQVASLGLKTVDGALVVNVVQGGAASRAGIQKGDIITAIGSTNITCADALFSYFGGQAKPGNGILVHVSRGTQTLSLNVTTDGVPENQWWISVPVAGSAVPIPES